MRELAHLFGQVDAVVFVTITAIVALASLLRKRRPVTKSRAMDIALSAVLFVFLGVRSAVLCALVVLFPTALLPGASPSIAATYGVLYAVAALVGVVTHRGSVGARVTGALMLAVVGIFETVGSAVLLDGSSPMVIDSAVAVAVAALAGVFAAFFWTYRTATPNPLGSDKRPFDY